MPLTPSGTSLRDLYAQESAEIAEQFAQTSDGRCATESRASLVDRIVVELCRETLDAEPHTVPGLALVAVGGYGRRELFPYSDVDLLFLFADAAAERRYREPARTISRMLWDLRMRLSPVNRLVEECERFHRDNPEFNVAVLDHRYITGDEDLFSRLHRKAFPRLLARNRAELLDDISELTRARHEKEGHTIFHLEPNLKNSPGGLRDFHVARWVALLARGGHDGNAPAPESLWPAETRAEMERAFEFLAAARCFLHYRQGRDDNTLSYESQAEAAARGIGVAAGQPLDPALWMRIYFRHARAVYGLSTQLLDQARATPASLRGWLEDWRARRAHPEFFVLRGRAGLHAPEALRDPQKLMELFGFVARRGVQLSREAEEEVRAAVSALRQSGRSIPALWEHLRHILVQRHAADALRAMHSAGLLVWLFPEFAAIDSLVIRDFYHHYTVDAHSFIAIDNIHRLKEARQDWERPFGELLTELEQPELLFLALLFHDVGKGMPCEDHIAGSLEAVEGVFVRLALRPEDADTVRFLIREHLAMSANLLRRDIFDPATVRAFAAQVGTPERLKLLCLFTYADIRAVNPDALTPWKAESLWQLYVSTANHMSRSLDEERIHAEAQDRQFIERIAPLVGGAARREELDAFLEGLPRRYLLAHRPEEIAAHFEMSRRLEGSRVESRLEKNGESYALTLLATDRPLLFAGISGTLAAWGMNIWKAEAFANARGVVVDSFRFTDPHRTLELNPTEAARLQRNIADVLAGKVRLETLMRGRAAAQAGRAPKVSVPTRIHFDDASSSHSTLMEIVTQDRPGLLYRLSAVLARHGCNIEVALIDTEGQRAVDSFYLTVGGRKLDAELQKRLSEALLTES